MPQTKTISNVLILSQTRDTVKELLQEKYESVIAPLITTIEMVMKANDENHFSAMYRIKNQTNLADTPEKQSLFAAALYEIIEEKNLKSLK